MLEFEFDEESQKQWNRTEIVREYKRSLYSFGDMELPYMFAAEHKRFSDRTIVNKGVMLAKKPHIILPGYNGLQLQEGFSHSTAAIHIYRILGLPYCAVTNRIVAEQELSYGSLQDVVDDLYQELEAQRDETTGLIKGMAGCLEASLLFYFLRLSAKSCPKNIEEFLDHKRRQRGRPINPNERFTDDDFRRLIEE